MKNKKDYYDYTWLILGIVLLILGVINTIIYA